MFCKNCGAQLKDNDAFCSSCGSKCEPQSTPPQSTPPQNMYVQGINPPHEKSNKNIVLYIIIGVLAVALIVVTGLFIFKDNKPVSEIKPDSVPQASSDITPNPGIQGEASKDETSQVETTPVPDTVKLTLNISLEENAFFAQYGVDVLINGTLVSTVNQGKTINLEYELEKGTYSITLKKNKGMSDEWVNLNIDPVVMHENLTKDTIIDMYLITHKTKIEVSEYTKR